MTIMITKVLNTTRVIVALPNQISTIVVSILLVLPSYQDDLKLINHQVTAKVLPQEKFNLDSRQFLAKVLEGQNNNSLSGPVSHSSPLSFHSPLQGFQTTTVHHSLIVWLILLRQHLRRLFQLLQRQDQLQLAVQYNQFHLGQLRHLLADRPHKGLVLDQLQLLVVPSHQEGEDHLITKKSLMLFHLDFHLQLYQMVQTQFHKATVDFLKRTEMFLEDQAATESIQHLDLADPVEEAASRPII